MSVLGRATWRELGGDRPLLVLPLGSTEQHGPHLPLDTDTRIASAVAHGLAQRLEPLLVGAALPYGASGEHAGFPGTVSLGTQVLERVVVELVRSVDDTARAVVLVNGHGGNIAALRSARRILAGEGRPVFLWAPVAALAATVGVPAADRDLHAGRGETSLLLHLAPDLVRLDLAVAGPSPSLAELLARGVAALSPSGVLGDPAGASAAEGARLLDAYVDDAVERLLDWTRHQGLTPPTARTVGRSA
ncbi:MULTISPECIES: mycofactocin biosynthesis peptidyl-dipeptidase MftE [Frankia]|uniref:mycofactocin biosynthesis peptidyl-dipeptidase MftE n=1 Tax=Frankia TaxID=1854 RepID=UPI0002F7C16C|nr:MULTISPECIES: mycofactocin biosynthesis peptidyl-dipeptidase MftE [Frankia]